MTCVKAIKEMLRVSRQEGEQEGRLKDGRKDDWKDGRKGDWKEDRKDDWKVKMKWRP